MKHGAVLAIAGLLLSGGCRKAADRDAGGRVTLRYLANPDVGGFAKETIRRFEAENPGISVEMVEGPAATNTREDMYAASFMAKEDTYDLVYMDVAWVPKFAAQGWLRPLDEDFTPELQKDFLPGDLAGSRFEGKLYRLPLQSDGGMLFYRSDLVSQPPKTWDELRAAAQKTQRPPELWGFVFEGKQYEGLVCVFLEALWGFGGDVFALDAPPGVKALSFLRDTVGTIAPPSVLTFQEEEARRAFQEGHAVFMRNWPYAWKMLQAEGSPVRGKVGVAPVPGGAATLGGWGFGVSAYSRHPKEAWAFAWFSARPEIQRLAFERGGILPTRRALYSDPRLLATAPYLRGWETILAGARPRPLVPNYARLSDSLQEHVSAALSGQETPEKAAAEAAKEIRAAERRR